MLTATTVTGGVAVVQALAAHGVDLVFGIPGTHTLPIHRHLTASGVPDLAALGRAFGGEGVRIDDPTRLAPALREALERPGPTVIEIPA